MALLLFDIDGTLLAPRDMGRRAFERALGERYPGRPLGPRFPYDGLLDPQIVTRTLETMGLQAEASAVENLIEAYLGYLEAERPASSLGYLCPGVPGILEEALRRGHTLGVLTGNVARGARLKLNFFGLGVFFPSGAFGEDAPERSGLVPVAMERVRKADGSRFGAGETWIIGDSPRDWAAARDAAIRCALVATGGTARATLAALAPDLLLDDLADAAPLWQIVERTA